MQNRAQVKKIIPTINIVLVLVCIWPMLNAFGIGIPRPPLGYMILIALVPWLVIYIWRIGEKSSLSLLAYIMALITLPQTDIKTIEWHSLAVVGFIISCFLCAIAYKNINQFHKARRNKAKCKFCVGFFALFMILVGTSYGYGLAMLVNVLFDSSPVVTAKVKIDSKYVSPGGYRRDPVPYLILNPWGGYLQEDKEAVDWEIYKQSAAGKDICIGTHRGALGVSWYKISLCPD